MLVGYCRVSTRGQTLDGQRDALLAYGCERIFEEVASGARSDRPILCEALDFARTGDTLVCTKLDRVARSMSHLITLMQTLQERGIEFRSLGDELDTRTPGGTLTFHIFAAISQFERDLIRERTSAGLEAARKRGRVGGRPRVMTEDMKRAARALMDNGLPVREVADAIGVSVPTIYRHLPASRSP